MKRFTEQQLRSKSGRKPGYVEAVMQVAVRDGEWLTVTDEQAEELRRRFRVGVGDVVASVATPIARVLGLDCIDKDTGKLKPESPCAKRKAALNRAVPLPCTSCGGPADGLRRLGGG